MRPEYFGMRRANGDWFAIEIDNHNRVLLFTSLSAAWRTRAKNPELILFWPALIEERALEHFATLNNGSPASFWLLEGEEDALANLSRGHPLEYIQLATLERVRAPGIRPKTRWSKNQNTNVTEWAIR